MGLFDKFKKKNEPVKEKVFEDYFMEIQSDMVSICLEYVFNKADKIYIYASFENNIVTAGYFYNIDGTVLKRHKLNDARNDFAYDVSPKRQKDCMTIIIDDIKQLNKLCKKYNRPMPTEIKMIYDVKTKQFNADYKYDLVYSNHKNKTTADIENEWYEEVKVIDNLQFLGDEMSYEKLKRQVDNYYAYRMTVDDGNKVGGSSGFGSFIIKVLMVLIVLSIIGHIIG